MKLLNKFSISRFQVPVLLILISLFFFWPFIVKGKIPIPADTIVGMYHPWRDVVWDGFTSGVPFKNPLITDPVRQQYVWKELAIEQYKKLQWPLWNPYTHSGMPLLANFQTAAFYPANLLFFIFNFKTTWGIFILLQPILASLFMYYYLKNIGLKKTASGFGGLVFAFCGFFVAWMEWGNIGHTLLWLPLILLSIEKLLKKQSKLWSLILVISLASSFFAGHLQTSFYVILFSAVYLIFKLLVSKKRIKFKDYSLFLILYFIFFLITSVQWLPTMQLIFNSARNIDITQVLQRNNWFLPYKHLIQLIVPDFFGNPTTGNYWSEWNYGEFVSFIGVIPLFFVIYSLWNLKKNKFVCFFSLTCLFFLLLALPTPLAKLPYFLKLSFISSAQPSRILCLVDFCLAVLAAIGLNYFIILKNQTKKLIITAVFLSAVIILLWLFCFNASLLFPEAPWLGNLEISQRNLILPTVIFGGLLALLVVKIIRLNTTLQYVIVAGGIFLLTIFDLFRFGWKFTPFSPPQWIFPETKTTEFLQKDNSIFRIMSTDRRLMPANFSPAYRLQTIAGYDPLYLKDYAKIITELESGEKNSIASFNRIIEPANYKSELVDKLNVKYVLALQELDSDKLEKVFQEGETRVYYNENYLPRAVLLPFFIKDEVDIVSYLPGKIVLKTRSQNPKKLTLADMNYPGWQVKINNQNSAIEKTSQNFRKIKLNEKENTIEFYYWPKIFMIGMGFSLLGFICLALFLLKKKS